MAWLHRKGPGQKIATTKIVNDAEPILKDNLAVFLAGPKTQEDKDYALAVFNTIWKGVLDACGNPQFGNPGHACIDDRQRGGKWDWFGYYYDPIANTPPVKTQTEVLGSYVSDLAGMFSLSGDTTNLPLVAGLGLIGIAIFMGDN